MTDIINSKSDLGSSISELESLGLKFPNLNELKDTYQIKNLVENQIGTTKTNSSYTSYKGALKRQHYPIS